MGVIGRGLFLSRVRLGFRIGSCTALASSFTIFYFFQILSQKWDNQGVEGVVFWGRRTQEGRKSFHLSVRVRRVTGYLASINNCKYDMYSTK